MLTKPSGQYRAAFFCLAWWRRPARLTSRQQLCRHTSQRLALDRGTKAVLLLRIGACGKRLVALALSAVGFVAANGFVQTRADLVPLRGSKRGRRRARRLPAVASLALRIDSMVPMRVRGWHRLSLRRSSGQRGLPAGCYGLDGRLARVASRPPVVSFVPVEIIIGILEKGEVELAGRWDMAGNISAHSRPHSMLEPWGRVIECSSPARFGTSAPATSKQPSRATSSSPARQRRCFEIQSP